MGVYIKGMEMPDSCDVCRFSDWSNLHQTACCKILEYKPCFNDFSSEYKTRISDLCLLVEVTEPHGDLIDKSELMKRELGWYKERVVRMDEGIRTFVYHAIQGIDQSPTIIKAEGE